MRFNGIKYIFGCLSITAVLSMIFFLPTAERADAKADQESSTSEAADTDTAVKKKELPPGPMDEYNRGTPGTAVEGFFAATQDGDFKAAAEYLDLNTVSPAVRPTRGPELARQLNVVLERSLVIDPEVLSTDPKGNTEDGLKPNQEVLGQLKTPEKTVDILLHRVTREDGVMVWKFSRRTVASISHLNTYFGYRPFEEQLSRFFPNAVFLGWQLWQYVPLIFGIGLAYLVAYCLSLAVRWLVLRSNREVGKQMEVLGIGPVRILLWFFLADRVIAFIGPSVTIRAILRQDLLGIIAVTWALSRLVELSYRMWINRLTKRGQISAIPLLKPAKTFLNVIIIVLFWYHPTDYWAFMALSQRINKQIMQAFEKEGIAFALPSQTVYTDSTAASGHPMLGEA